MNQTATTGGAPGASLIPSSTGAFTAAHLAVMAIFAIAIIVAIVWGARLKTRRKAAERTIASHNAEVESTTAPPSVTDAPTMPRTSAPESIDERSFVEPVPVETIAPDPFADEPVAAAAPFTAAPAFEAASVPPASASPADAPVGTLKGLGPKLVARLGELGITNVGQIAALSDDEAARLDAQLGPFAGRITRDRWIEQARFLAAGDRAGFEAVFGRL